MFERECCGVSVVGEGGGYSVLWFKTTFIYMIGQSVE